MTYWHYVGVIREGANERHFTGVISNETHFFPLKKLMQSHFTVTGLSRTLLENAVEISQEDYEYYLEFAKEMNMNILFGPGRNFGFANEV